MVSQKSGGGAKQDGGKVGGGMPSSGVVYYEGTWQSNEYPGLVASGAVVAQVDFSTRSAKILLRYDGLYNRGVTKTMETKIEGMPSGLASASAESLNLYVFSLKDSSGSATVKQKLQFTASSITAAAIIGTYTSRAPSDNGTFQMKAVSHARFQEWANNNSGACNIM
jgi:hypothetical protein